MSRSVTMPGPSPSGSITTAAPTRRSAISFAASRSVWPGPTVRTTLLIPSRTCIRQLLSVVCNDPLNRTACSRVRTADPRRRTAAARAPRPFRAATRHLWSRGATVIRGPDPRIRDCPSSAQPPSATARASSRRPSAIVEAEYASDLSLDDIARRVASSRRQLQRAYAEIGTRPSATT